MSKESHIQETKLLETIHILTQKNELFDIIFQNLPIGVAVSKISDGKFTYINNSFFDIYGNAEAEIKDMPTLLKKVGYNDIFDTALTKTTDQNTNNNNFEGVNQASTTIITQFGKKKIVDCKNIPLHQQDLMITIVTDVTNKIEQSKAIQQDQTSNQEALINGTEDLIWSVDTDMNVITANNAFTTRIKILTGKLLKEGDPLLLEAFGEELVNKWMKYYQKALQGQFYWVKDENYNPETSSIDYFKITFTPIFNNNQQLYGVACFAKSITEEVVAKQRLEISEEKYRFLFYQSPLPKWVYHINTFQILDINETAIEHYGYSRDEFLTMTLRDILLKTDFATLLDEQKRAIDKKGVLRFGVFTHKKKNGLLIKVEASGHVINYQNQDCMIVVCNDVTERENAELERKLLLDNTEESFILLDTELRIVSYNKQYKKIFKKYLHKEIAKGEFILSYGTHKQIDEAQKKYSSVLAGNIDKSELSFTEEDGTLTIFSLTYKPALNEQGIIIGVFTTVKDITEEAQILSKIKESNQRYEYVTKATSDAIWDWDLTNDKVIWGEGFQTIFGHNLTEIKADISFKLNHFHPDDKDRVSQSFLKTVKAGQCNWEEEYRFLKADKTYAHVITKGLIIYDENFCGIRMVGGTRDITNQKKEEQRLQILESVIIHSTDAVIITEAEPLNELGPNIIYVNEAFTKMTGYTSEEIIGKTPRILQGSKSDKNNLTALGQAMKSKQPYEITTVNYKKNGEEFWVNFKVSPVTDINGCITHFIVIERDVTESKNKELQETLLAEISRLFNETTTLNETLHNVMMLLVASGNFCAAETWLVSKSGQKVNLVAKYEPNQTILKFYDETDDIKSFKKGEGLPGEVWDTKMITYCKNTDNTNFENNLVSKQMGLPIIYNNEFIGVLVLVVNINEPTAKLGNSLIENLVQNIAIEIKRKQLEQELSQIFSFAPDIICVASANAYFIKINPTACAMLEYTEQELLSVPFTRFMHPDDVATTIKEIIQLNNKGNSNYYFENRCITKSGKTKWLSWTAAQSSIDEGLFVCVAKDITEKKELENLLEEANKLAIIGNWDVDMVKGTYYWSNITKEIHETLPEFEPTIQKVSDFYKEGENRDKFIDLIEMSIKNGTAWDEELEIITAKGNSKWVRAIGKAQITGGECTNIYGSLQDISIRKNAEIAFINTLEEKNIILESIADAFFAVDKNWIVTYWNSKAAELLQAPKDTILGKNMWDVFSTKVGGESYLKLTKAIETNQMVQYDGYSNFANIWYEASAYPSETGLSVYLKDISERKRYEIHLQKLNESLKNQSKSLALSNAELEQFAYVASHDLQEPLRMVTSFLTQLDKKYGDILDAKGKMYINFAVDGAKRMRQIILDLLEFSRIGREEYSNEQVDLNELFEEIPILFRKKIQEKKAIIHVDQLPIITGYKAPLRQVFQNLISNALKYTREVNPQISVTVTDLENHWQFAIADNGIGIGEEYFDRIFIIFQRLHNKNEFSGTGMGLAVTKKIIENLKGKIWVKSIEGQGSTFYFTIIKN
ncbi:MAG: PAS domain S-box protein [Pedobacter sp.]|nr:PAS domain S-box protein [Chitinophagaceae bacterium]